MRFIPGLQGCSNIWKSFKKIHHINIIKEKNYTIPSTDMREAFDKIQW